MHEIQHEIQHLGPTV